MSSTISRILVISSLTISFTCLALFFSFLPYRAVVGELDEALDSRMDLSEIRAPPLKPLTH